MNSPEAPLALEKVINLGNMIDWDDDDEEDADVECNV